MSGENSNQSVRQSVSKSVIVLTPGVVLILDMSLDCLNVSIAMHLLKLKEFIYKPVYAVIHE